MVKRQRERLATLDDERVAVLNIGTRVGRRSLEARRIALAP